MINVPHALRGFIGRRGDARCGDTATGTRRQSASAARLRRLKLKRGTTMREPHEYDDIPGTTVFDAERSRQGMKIWMAGAAGRAGYRPGMQTISAGCSRRELRRRSYTRLHS